MTFLKKRREKILNSFYWFSVWDRWSPNKHIEGAGFSWGQSSTRFLICYNTAAKLSSYLWPIFLRNYHLVHLLFRWSSSKKRNKKIKTDNKPGHGDSIQNSGDLIIALIYRMYPLGLCGFVIRNFNQFYYQNYLLNVIFIF